MLTETDSISYYKCGNCGQMVPYQGTHYCQPQGFTYSFGQLVTPDAETKELLKRIADALEKIAKK